MRNRRYASGVLAAAVMFLGGTVFATLPAQARTNHALLVAVTKYPNVKGADLVGPNNDAQLVRDFLGRDVSLDAYRAEMAKDQ